MRLPHDSEQGGKKKELEFLASNRETSRGEKDASVDVQRWKKKKEKDQ